MELRPAIRPHYVTGAGLLSAVKAKHPISKCRPLVCNNNNNLFLLQHMITNTADMEKDQSLGPFSGYHQTNTYSSIHYPVFIIKYSVLGHIVKKKVL